MDLMRLSHGAGQNSYHFVWNNKHWSVCVHRHLSCRLKPKYAKKILVGEVNKFCEQILHEIADKYEFVLHTLKVMPDHIHVFLSFKPTYSVSKVFNLLKGISARRIFQSFPQLRETEYWGGHLWSRGKFWRSVGSTTDIAVQHYIEYSQGEWKTIQHQIETLERQQSQIKTWL